VILKFAILKFAIQLGDTPVGSACQFIGRGSRHQEADPAQD
jgi:hypothetical protein